MKAIKELNDVVSSHLCIGCGACKSVCSEGKIEIIDYFSEGLRPRIVTPLSDKENQEALKACPVVQSDYTLLNNEPRHPKIDASFNKKWGHITEIWEGHASDSQIRFKGSSGGAITAINIYCIEKLNMEGVLHIAQDPNNPILNKTRLSKTREELITATGSRYSPASVCDSLKKVEEASAPCAIVGKPSEIAAVRNVEKINGEFAKKVGVTISFFCAETPPTKATHELLRNFNISPLEVKDLRYRGYGWPGYFAPIVKEENEPRIKKTYRETWAYLQKFRPWSTQIWPDGSGELADISCGDPWYEEPDGKNPGFSLIVARSKIGKEIIEGAIAAGYLTLEKAEPWKLEKSQLGLLEKKGATWGRHLAMKLTGMPTTHFKGLNHFHCWKRLTLTAKIKSTLGTLRRIIQRKLYRSQKLHH